MLFQLKGTTYVYGCHAVRITLIVSQTKANLILHVDYIFKKKSNQNTLISSYNLSKVTTYRYTEFAIRCGF